MMTREQALKFLEYPIYKWSIAVLSGVSGYCRDGEIGGAI